jgi:mono/diheme cytochrome c family protein
VSRRLSESFQARSRTIVLILLLGLAALHAGCSAERRKSDAELGLTPQQAAGRRVYDAHCDSCHEPYSSSGKKGPSLKGLFRHEYMRLSGLPANDDRVGDIINAGRNGMPGYRQAITPQELADLMAYLHTL